ncbi:MAG: sensor histidine kinase [Gemmatimonadales bacterium]
MAADRMRITRIMALALAVGTLFTAQTVLTQLHSGRPVDVGQTVAVALLFWGLWALLTPLVVLAVRRWPFDTKPIYRPILLHAAISIVTAVVQTMLALGLRFFALFLSGAVERHEAPKAIASPTALAWGAFAGVFFYWLVAAVDSVLRFRGRYAALESELNRSKLDALRSQLRPHFLFNTLNAISGLVPQGDNAHRMILRLSSLLRRSLDEDSHEVPLQAELTFLNDYLDIQRLRFGDQLVIDVDMEPSALVARVPVFLLQPLLENAIEYGESDDGHTTVRLSARRDGDQLVIRIEDDGPGVAPLSSVHEGIGLGNSRARLQHLYGSRATVELSAQRDGSRLRGTSVVIRLPWAASP